MVKTVEITGKEGEKGCLIMTQGACAPGCISWHTPMTRRSMPGQSAQTTALLVRL